jgi:predicted transcriptional regulator
MLGAWTSPADFGGERGTLTPAWWGEWNSQYGLLKTWRVDQEGAFIDGQFLSKVVIGDLRLDQQPFIQVRVGVKPDAAHVGGLNLFGREFGNHAQDMTLRLSF